MYLLVASSHSQGLTLKVDEYQLQLSEGRSNQGCRCSWKANDVWATRTEPG